MAFMKTLQEERYKADGTRTATVETILLPLWLAVEKPTLHLATREARALVEQLQVELAQFTPRGAKLEVGDFVRPQTQKASQVVMEQEGRDNARLELDFHLVLSLQPGQFWERTELIAQAIDLVYRFSTKPRDKHIALHLQPARLVESNQTPAPAQPSEAS